MDQSEVAMRTDQLLLQLEEYHKLLDLLRSIKAGDVDVRNVKVSHNGWVHTPPTAES